MSDKLTKPIVNLMKIADKVSLGQLQQEVPVSGNDEITDLGNSFQRMINAFKLQQAMYAEDAEGGNHEPL
jgi:nitrogen fixation/metabolism regulation signal transduction histidine kinase